MGLRTIQFPLARSNNIFSMSLASLPRLQVRNQKRIEHKDRKLCVHTSPYSVSPWFSHFKIWKHALQSNFTPFLKWNHQKQCLQLCNCEYNSPFRKEKLHIVISLYIFLKQKCQLRNSHTQHFWSEFLLFCFFSFFFFFVISLTFYSSITFFGEVCLHLH